MINRTYSRIWTYIYKWGGPHRFHSEHQHRYNAAAINIAIDKEINKVLNPLFDLLSVIHRDGGQYTEKNGLKESINQARTLSSNRIHQMDTITNILITENQLMRQALKESFEETGYCELCEQHDHSRDCLLYEGPEV